MKTFSRVLIFAAAGAMLAACAKDDGITTASFESIKASVPVPVTFGTYMGETAETRAGFVGEMTTAQLQATSENKGGFGVFGYYSNGTTTTDGTYYAATLTPNFMWNQGIFFNTTDNAWEYSPIKYWPNETKSDGTNGASSDHADKLSFFAYAPYVTPETKSSGEFSAAQTTGITKISGNEDAGDPKVSYSVDFTGLNSVDLLWGVASSDYTTSSVNSTYPNTITVGYPFIDLVKQQTNGKISFDFKHALSRLALTVQAANDREAAGGTELYSSTEGDAHKSKILIESVEITGNFPTNGKLNLHNTIAGIPNWVDVLPTTSTSKTIVIDGQTNNNLRKDLIYNSSNTAAASVAGVTTATPKHIIAASSEDTPTDKYLMFIPSDDITSVTVKITYHVITDDANLSEGKSDITNVISKTISPAGTATKLFEAGKAYKFNLVLGVTSVKVEATVSTWGTETETTVNLPINVAATPAP